MIVFHSQPITRQDEWVIKKLDGKKRGTFVEVGAYDGLRHSNTLTLERQFCWYGLLVEPNRELFRQMVVNRPRCRHSALAISNQPSIARFVYGGPFSGLVEFMPPDWKAEHYRRGNPTHLVKTGPLAPLLNGCLDVDVIDYLSLDTEGSEYAILSNYFGGRHKPIRCMTVEFRYDGCLLQQLESLLEPHGYVLDDVRGCDACFLNPEYIK